MKIQSIQCEQFAGLQDCEARFEDGINLIVGPNEAGKSTLVDLLYQTLFQNASLDKRSDKLFMERYFPKTTGAVQADAIDGTLRMETDDGTFVLRKEWDHGRNGACRLTLPDGTSIRDPQKIRDVLEQQLVYGKGIYDEVVFASQRRQQTALQGLFGAESGVMGELSLVLRRAVMETGGIDTGRLERALEERLEPYEGSWDFEMDMPKGGKQHGIENRWKRNVGSILAAYYQREEAKAQKEQALKNEKAVEDLTRQVQQAKAAHTQEQSKWKRFVEVSGQIKARKHTETLLEKAEQELKEQEDAQKRWPEAAAQLREVKKLKTQLEQAQKKALYETVSGLKEQENDLQAKLEKNGTVDADDVKTAAELERDIAGLESQIRGMNLTADIRQLGDAQIEVVSAVSGLPMEHAAERFDLTEAVCIRIPGVAEIRLAPKGVDMDAITAELGQKRGELAALLGKYGAASAEKLQQRLEQRNDLQWKLQQFQRDERHTLGDTDWDELKSAAAALPDDLPDERTVQAALRGICGGQLPDTFCGGLQTELNVFEKKYADPDKLRQTLEETKQDVERCREELDGAGQLPEEFRDVSDPETYEARLKKLAEDAETKVERCRNDLTAAERQLGDRTAEEYEEEIRKADESFRRQKEEHAHWKHIQDVFLDLKETSMGNPMTDLEAAFRRNLSELSGDRLRAAEMDERLKTQIASGGHPLNAEILSEGTKDTVSLAFRLAVLEHLYPDGGCVAVFDDPFTDMDPQRTAAACRLLSKFAEHNQVIFATCDEKYKPMLHGHLLEMRAN